MMDDLIEWCTENSATVYFRRRSRTTFEVLIELADGLTATAPNLDLAIDAIKRKRAGRRPPAPIAHDPLVPYRFRPVHLRDNALPHLSTPPARRRSLRERLRSLI